MICPVELASDLSGLRAPRVGTYPFENKAAGSFQLFIVPTGDGQKIYLATFNLL